MKPMPATDILCNSRTGPKIGRNLGDYQSAGDNHVPDPDEQSLTIESQRNLSHIR